MLELLKVCYAITLPEWVIRAMHCEAEVEDAYYELMFRKEYGGIVWC